MNGPKLSRSMGGCSDDVSSRDCTCTPVHKVYVLVCDFYMLQMLCTEQHISFEIPKAEVRL